MSGQFHNDSFASSEINEEQKSYFVDAPEIERDESIPFFNELREAQKRRTESFTQAPFAYDTIKASKKTMQEPYS